MPIIQSRLLRLLEAGEVYHRRYQTLRLQISTICSNYTTKRPQMTAEEAMSQITAAIMVTPEYMPADVVLNEERTLYTQTHRKNQYEKQRLRDAKTGAPRAYKTRTYKTIPDPPALGSVPLVLDAHPSIGPADEDMEVDDLITSNNPTKRAWDEAKADFEKIQAEKEDE